MADFPNEVNLFNKGMLLLLIKRQILRLPTHHNPILNLPPEQLEPVLKSLKILIALHLNLLLCFENINLFNYKVLWKVKGWDLGVGCCHWMKNSFCSCSTPPSKPTKPN